MATEVTEEKVVSTEAAPATGKGAFAAARASLSQSTDQATETVDPVDDKPSDAQPAQDAAKVADESQATTDDTDQLLTAEEVAKLSPKERGLYQKAQADYTRKTQKLAAERKEMEPWQPLIKALTEDPDAALEDMAKRRGFTLTRPAQDTTKQVEAHTAEALANLPEELQFLKPVFEQYGKAIVDKFEGKLKPIADAQSQMISEAAAAETQATVEAFTAKYPGWEKHQAKMVELGKKFIPTAGAMTDFEYMETLHKLASAGEAEADKTKKVVDKINRATASSETRASGVPPERVEHVLPPPGKRGIREAYEAAKRGETWSK